MFANIALRSEYSFKQTFGKIESLIDYGKESGFLGVADFNNTFSHVKLEQACKKENIKPIFGVRLEVLKENVKQRGLCGPIYIFIAKNNQGLFEINNLVKTAYDRFYYKPFICVEDVTKLSKNVFVIAENVERLDRVDYIALTPATCNMLIDVNIPKVYIQDNFYCTPKDKEIYQLMAGTQKRGDEYIYKFNKKTVPQHILSEKEFDRLWKCSEAAENTLKIAEQCDVTLPRAKMVKYQGNQNIDSICKLGAKQREIDLNDPIYKARYEREMELIKQKEYVDYFMITYEMVDKAKKQMFVGPARGSAAGSLVCYLMGITEVDPIPYGLLFERFIDITREDLPDIDIDFPDNKRDLVIKDLIKTHGADNVCHIANINLMKPKSAINDFGIALKIPKYEVDQIKDSIITRSSGDARAGQTIKDTFDTTDLGKEFIKNNPKMELVCEVQNHASHAGKHAAGIIVCNDEIAKFGSMNTRDGCIMMDKKGAEYLNLLKIDCLGLRTLSVLEECADLIGMDYKDYYKLPLDDKKTYKIFSDMRLDGIFQFEGSAMHSVCKHMGVENFNDIVAITGLARPGPLHSGGTSKFADTRIGKREVEYICDHPIYIEATKETFGIFIYQEQLMKVARELGAMSWEDVSQLRKAMSRSLGEEFFNKYKNSFFKGTRDKNIDDEIAEKVWSSMMTFGSWGMNKSHTVSYGYISYWCAYMKTHHPLEFYVATLNHSKNETASIKILRDALENSGIDYIPIDPDNSKLKWSVYDGKLLGGLCNIKGIAEKKAKEILNCRSGKKKWTIGLINKLMNPETPYDILYPCKNKWGFLYDAPQEWGLIASPSEIADVHKEGIYTFIGKVIVKDLRDLNDYNEVQKRGGEVYHTNNLFLKLFVEDDTDQIQCRINRFKFQKLHGHHLAETLQEGESWVLIKGKINSHFRLVMIDKILHLDEYFKDQENVQ